MNMLEACTHLPLAKALGCALFHFLWEGAAIAALLMVAFFVFRPAAARARYGLACAALLAMPLAFAITLAVSLPSAPAHFTVHPAAALPGDWAAAPAGREAPAPIALANRLAWAAPFWLAGVVGIFLYRCAGWMAAQRLRRVGCVAAPETWRLRLEALAREARIARPVVLLESCLAEVPAAIGWLRPAILTPLGMLAGLPADQVEAILLHELAHIRRADYAVNLLQTAIEGVLFYHPAVWWISGVVRAEREHCCDDWAAGRLGNAHQYAVALATFESSRWHAPSAAMAASGSNLARRIRRLLAKPDARDLMVPVAPSLLLVALGGVALAAWGQHDFDRQPVPPAQPVQTAQAQPKPAAPEAGLSPAYTKWLQEDVAYIITSDERVAFQQLHTDAEREDFIEQFWERRNPVPGASDNQFKTEHYRRIAYANEHFASPGGRTPGWRTVRGRVYIINGPPEEIFDYTKTADPHQVWKYRWAESARRELAVRFDAGKDGFTMASVGTTTALFHGEADGGGPLPGGHVLVSVSPGGQEVSIPLNFPPGPLRIWGQLRTASGRVLKSFEDNRGAADAQAMQQDLYLVRGSYVLTVKVQNPGTGQTYGEKVAFEAM